MASTRRADLIPLIDVHFARENDIKRRLRNVRFGSLADIETSPHDVSFTAEGRADCGRRIS